MKAFNFICHKRNEVSGQQENVKIEYTDSILLKDHIIPLVFRWLARTLRPAITGDN